MSAKPPHPHSRRRPPREAPSKAGVELALGRPASSDESLESPRSGRSPTGRELRRRCLLGLAGLATLAVALLQAVISLSPDVSRALGAPPELTDRPVALMFAGWSMAAALAVLGIYGLAAGGFPRRRQLPLQRCVVWLAGFAFTIRGMLPALLGDGAVEVQPKTAVATSVLSLVIGFLYLGGLAPTLFRTSEPTSRARGGGR